MLSPGSVVLAETYPAEALRHLGMTLRGSKRRHADRCATADALMTAMDRQAAMPDDAMRQAVVDGFGADASGEDRFDSVLGVLCVLNVLAGNRPDTAPADPWIQRWEGWVLGQTALPREDQREHARERRGAFALPTATRTSGGRLIRIASTLPPVFRPNSVPRSWIRLNST